MTREESLELFDLPEEATKEEITEKYREMYSDYMLRLTNAPTPNLKKIYNQNIQKLESAFKTLCPDADIDETQFLPSDKPILGTTGSNININISNKVDGKKEEKKPEKKPKSGSSLSLVFVLLAVLFFSVGLSFFIMYMKREKVIAAQEEKFKILREDSLQMHTRFAPFEKNGKLKVVNKCSFNVTVNWLSILFLDEKTNQIRHVKFMKEYVLKSGESRILENFDSGVNWDGSVIFYDLRIKRDDAAGSNAYFNGIWANENKNGEVYLTPAPVK